MSIVVLMLLGGCVIFLMSLGAAVVGRRLFSSTGGDILVITILVGVGLLLLGGLGFSTVVVSRVEVATPMSPAVRVETSGETETIRESSVAANPEIAGSSEPPLSDRTSADASPPKPEWLSDKETQEGDSRYVVLSSKQYATEAEALNDANGQLLALFENDLRPIVAKSSHVRPRSMSLTLHHVEPAIHDRYTEQVQRDFGTFFAPMYRAWYRVELSPHMREPALASWRQQLVYSHLQLAMTLFALVFTIPAGIVLGARIRRWHPGVSGRILMGGMTLGLLAVWIGSVAWLSRQIIIS